MAAPSPLTDPNYAYDIPGWTNQNGTGDTIGVGIVQGTSSELVEPAALSGYISRTTDPDVTSSAGAAGQQATVGTGTAYLASMMVLQPAVSTKVIVNVKTAPVTPTYSAIALYNAVTGTQVAVTATTSTNFNTTGGVALNWVSAPVLTSGYYWALLLSIAATGVILNAYTLAGEAQLLLTSTGVTNFVVGTSKRFGVGATGLSALAAVPAALTGTMTVTTATSAWFIGIA